MSKIRAKSIHGEPKSKLVQIWHIPSDWFGPTSAEIENIGRIRGKSGRNRTTFGRGLSKSPKLWPDFMQIWPKSLEFGRLRADVGRNRTKFRQNRPILPNNWRDFVQIPPKSPKCGKVRSNLTEIAGIWARSSKPEFVRTLAEIRKSLTRFGRGCAKFVELAQTLRLAVAGNKSATKFTTSSPEISLQNQKLSQMPAREGEQTSVTCLVGREPRLMGQSRRRVAKRRRSAASRLATQPSKGRRQKPQL